MSTLLVRPFIRIGALAVALALAMTVALAVDVAMTVVAVADPHLARLRLGLGNSV